MHSIDRAEDPLYIPLLIDPALRLRPIALVDLAARDSVRVHRTAPVIRTPSASIAPGVAPQVDDPVDFSDLESQRVLRAAARAVARALGREAAREYFAEWIGKPKVS